MSGGGFGTDPDEVRAHAKKVADVSDRLGNAVSAAGQTTLNNQAFGLIGQFLVPVVTGIEGKTTATINSAQNAAEQMFNQVKAAADEYDRSDQDAAESVQTVQSHHMQGEIY